MAIAKASEPDPGRMAAVSSGVTMTRRRGSTNLSSFEVAEMRRLFLAGVRMAEIVRRTKRSEATVYRATRGLKRKRPTSPAGRHAKRNDRILAMVEQGMSRAAIADLLGMSPSQVGHVVNTHPRIAELLQKKRARPAEIARRYRMELSTALRIAGKGRKVRRTRVQLWHQP